MERVSPNDFQPEPSSWQRQHALIMASFFLFAELLLALGGLLYHNYDWPFSLVMLPIFFVLAWALGLAVRTMVYKLLAKHRAPRLGGN